MDRTTLLNLANQLKELDYRYTYKRIDFYFPPEGEFSKDKYLKQMSWMEAGALYPVRGLFGGNGTGKTLTAGVEVVYHLTGQYPEDWRGRRFHKPIKSYISTINVKQLRAGLQLVLFGSYIDPGTGLIPKKELLNDDGEVQVWALSGATIGSARIRHYTNGIFDGWSELYCLTYKQGWESFQGFNADVMWLDEDPRSAKLVSEAIARTRGSSGNEGLFIYTGVPLAGKDPI